MDLANKEEWPSRKEGSEVVLKEGRKENPNPGEISVSDSFQTVSDIVFQILNKAAPGPRRSSMVFPKSFHRWHFCRYLLANTFSVSLAAAWSAGRAPWARSSAWAFASCKAVSAFPRTVSASFTQFTWESQRSPVCDYDGKLSSALTYVQSI